jgi:hypothetical protein
MHVLRHFYASVLLDAGEKKACSPEWWDRVRADAGRCR